MKPATKRFFGVPIEIERRADLLYHVPAFSTTILSAIVIAST